MPTNVRPRPRLVEPVPIETHAMENIRFIRETMERSTAFTAVPGVHLEKKRRGRKLSRVSQSE